MVNIHRKDKIALGLFGILFVLNSKLKYILSLYLFHLAFYLSNFKLTYLQFCLIKHSYYPILWTVISFQYFLRFSFSFLPNLQRSFFVKISTQIIFKPSFYYMLFIIHFSTSCNTHNLAKK